MYRSNIMGCEYWYKQAHSWRLVWLQRHDALWDPSGCFLKASRPHLQQQCADMPRQRSNRPFNKFGTVSLTAMPPTCSRPPSPKHFPMFCIHAALPPQALGADPDPLIAKVHCVEFLPGLQILVVR